MQSIKGPFLFKGGKNPPSLTTTRLYLDRVKPELHKVVFIRALLIKGKKEFKRKRNNFNNNTYNLILMNDKIIIMPIKKYVSSLGIIH